MGFQTTVREWFRTGLRPDETQFFSFFAKIFWKDERIPIESIEGIEEILNDKAEAAVLNYHLDNPEAHAIQFDSKEDKNKKGVAGGYAPLDGFGRLTIDYLKYVNDLTTGGIDAVLTAEQGKALRDQIITINTALDTLLVNDLTTGGTTKALTAEQGKQLKIQINAINTLLTSDNVNLDTLQELVDAIETVQLSLSTILVNDLTTGGTTKALTAEMGKSLKALIDSLSTNKVDKAAGERLINASEITKLSGLSNVTTTVKTIVSTALASQDLAGFVAYINTLAVVLVVGANEIVEYKTSDTGRVFKLLLRGRSFGTGQPAITTADAIETTEWMNKDIKLSNYPSTRDDGSLPTNKILAPDVNGSLKLYKMATAPAPFMEILIPDSTLTNTTTNFTIKGAFFTPTMTVAIVGQVINYVTFVSDNKILVNVTTGATAGMYDVTLNNGLTAIYYNALLLTSGVIYKPNTADWTVLSGSPDLSVEGEYHISLYNATHSVKWNKAFDYTRNFQVIFRFKRSPTGSIGTEWGQGSFSSFVVALANAGGTVGFTTAIYSSLYCHHMASSGTPSGNLFYQSSGTATEKGAYFETQTISYKYISGVMYIYLNNALKFTYSLTITENLFLNIKSKTVDVVDIKYIELP